MAVAFSSKESDEQQSVWLALSDPTRRVMLDRLAHGPMAVTQMTVGFAMTRFGVAKHLSVLEGAGLVSSRKHGRSRLYHLNAARIEQLRRWMSPRAIAWAAGAKAFANSMEEHSMSEPLPVHRLASVDIALDWTLRVPQARAWDHFFSAPQSWWPSEFRVFGNATKMSFEAQIGGQLIERNEFGAAVTWYTIFALQPHQCVDLQGQLATRYGGPAQTLLHIEFIDLGKDTCSIKLTDSVFGRLGPEIATSITSGWNAIIGDGFVASLAR
jgi:DNA-binding transcriptional ArsR family regulator